MNCRFTFIEIGRSGIRQLQAVFELLMRETMRVILCGLIMIISSQGNAETTDSKQTVSISVSAQYNFVRTEITGGLNSTANTLYNNLPRDLESENSSGTLRMNRTGISCLKNVNTSYYTCTISSTLNATYPNG